MASYRSLAVFSAVLGCLAVVSAPGATTWTQPTADELKMTSDPAAPDAAAEYLNLDIRSARNSVTVYARIKILTERGKETYSNVRMEYVVGDEGITSVEGRTIHPDGTIIPFTGKPYDREVTSFRSYTRMEKVFSLPDVQVGSILEYRYIVRYMYIASPIWRVQRDIFVRRAEFHFEPNSDYEVQITQMLPPGVKVKGTAMSGYDLEMENIAPLADEEDSPPMFALGYRVEFLYSPFSSGAQFWKAWGKDWSGKVNEISSPSEKLKEAVGQLFAPGDTDEQKLEKIYAAIMKMENTSFTRLRTREEEKAERIKTRTANDVWTAQHGDRYELPVLFVTMARAAKMKAYLMYVTDRSEDLFLKDIPNSDQLDDFIAVVEVNGKEMYFDPGERYCEFGKLKWTHTWTGGVRQTDSSGAELATTPSPVYTDTDIERRADLQMDGDGQIHGTIRISMTGAEALRWRQEALRKDATETKQKFGEELESELPIGVHVKTNELGGLADYTQPLVAVLDVSGTMGTQTGHRLFLPGTFFEASVKPTFSSTRRETPVYMQFPYTEQDQFKLKLPPNVTMESVPPDTQLAFASNADFVSKYRNAGGVYLYARRIRVANILYQTPDYPQLRDFFQKVSAQDQQPAVLNRGPAKAAANAAGGAQ